MEETQCKGKGCEAVGEEVEMRQDAYGLPTGHYCDNCYDNNYPYRRDRYYDYLNAGEHMDDNY